MVTIASKWLSYIALENKSQDSNSLLKIIVEIWQLFSRKWAIFGRRNLYLRGRPIRGAPGDMSAFIVMR